MRQFQGRIGALLEALKLLAEVGRRWVKVEEFGRESPSCEGSRRRPEALGRS